MKRAAIVVLLSLTLSSCAYNFVPIQSTVRPEVSSYPDPDGADARRMMAQTVKINVEVVGKLFSKDAAGKVDVKDDSFGWMGSGSVVAVDASRGKGESLVLTAAHVSSTPKIGTPMFSPDMMKMFVVEAVLMYVETNDGRSCLADQIAADVGLDMGVLRVYCVAGEVAEVATELPPQGAMVTTCGAALGYHPAGVFIVTDGRYVGLTDDQPPEVVLTLPVAPGHSGSGVFYKGKIFAVVTKVFRSFHHITLATELSQLQRLIGEARSTWSTVR